jgi:hypothetical protein
LGKLKLCQSKAVSKTMLVQLCQAGRTAEITVALFEAEKRAGRTYADVPALTVAIAAAYKRSESERAEVCKLLQAERAPGGLLAGAPELTVPADVNTVYFAGGTLSVLGSLKAQKRTFGSVAELVAALAPGATAGAQAQQPAVDSKSIWTVPVAEPAQNHLVRFLAVFTIVFIFVCLLLCIVSFRVRLLCCLLEFLSFILALCVGV